MNNIINFLSEQGYKIHTFKLENQTYLQFSKHHLFLTVGGYFVHSIRLEENGFVLLLESEFAEKECRFNSEKACIDCLIQIILHEQKTKQLFQQLNVATM